MEFIRRQKTIAAPEVDDPEIFPDGRPRQFVIQNLEGPEVAFARERVRHNRATAALAEKLLGEKLPDVVDAIKEKLGLSDVLPNDYVYKIALIEFGTVTPEMTQEKAVRLGKNKAVTFYNLAQEIADLTALGNQLGK